MYWDVTGYEMGYICLGFSSYPPHRYYFLGDTIINNTVYAKAYQMELITTYPPVNCPPFSVDTNSTVVQYYFLREDTLEKKVWRYDSYNDYEMLLYDFSLEIGDTLYPHPWFPTLIDTVYEITTTDGLVRKKFEFGPGGESGYYIEGIGGVAGIFSDPFYIFETGSWLMCVKDINGNIIMDIDGSCFDFITSTAETKRNPKINIFPNPFSESITIKSPLSELHVIIYNQYGIAVINKDLGSEHIIDLSNLRKGIYLLKILKNNNLIYSEKIISENGL